MMRIMLAHRRVPPFRALCFTRRASSAMPHDRTWPDRTRLACPARAQASFWA